MPDPAGAPKVGAPRPARPAPPVEIPTSAITAVIASQPDLQNLHAQADRRALAPDAPDSHWTLPANWADGWDEQLRQAELGAFGGLRGEEAQRAWIGSLEPARVRAQEADEWARRTRARQLLGALHDLTVHFSQARAQGWTLHLGLGRSETESATPGLMLTLVSGTEEWGAGLSAALIEQLRASRLTEAPPRRLGADELRQALGPAARPANTELHLSALPGQQGPSEAQIAALAALLERLAHSRVRLTLLPGLGNLRRPGPASLRRWVSYGLDDSLFRRHIIQRQAGAVLTLLATTFATTIASGTGHPLAMNAVLSIGCLSAALAWGSALRLRAAIGHAPRLVAWRERTIPALPGLTDPLVRSWRLDNPELMAYEQRFWNPNGNDPSRTYGTYSRDHEAERLPNGAQLTGVRGLQVATWLDHIQANPEAAFDLTPGAAVTADTRRARRLSAQALHAEAEALITLAAPSELEAPVNAAPPHAPERTASN